MVSRDNIIINLPYGEYRKSDYENGHMILNWTSSTWKYCVYLFEGGLYVLYSTLNRHTTIMNRFINRKS